MTKPPAPQADAPPQPEPPPPIVVRPRPAVIRLTPPPLRLNATEEMLVDALLDSREPIQARELARRAWNDPRLDANPNLRHVLAGLVRHGILRRSGADGYSLSLMFRLALAKRRKKKPP